MRNRTGRTLRPASNGNDFLKDLRARNSLERTVFTGTYLYGIALKLLAAERRKHLSER